MGCIFFFVLSSVACAYISSFWLLLLTWALCPPRRSAVGCRRDGPATERRVGCTWTDALVLSLFPIPSSPSCRRPAFLFLCTRCTSRQDAHGILKAETRKAGFLDIVLCTCPWCGPDGVKVSPSVWVRHTEESNALPPAVSLAESPLVVFCVRAGPTGVR